MKTNRWTYRDIDTLRREYPVRSAEEVAAMLGRSVDAVFVKAYKLGLRKDHYGIAWTPRMLKLLKDFFPTMFNDALARWIGVSKRSLIRKARELGLEKKPGFLKDRAEDIQHLARTGLKRSNKVRGRIQKGEHFSPSTEFKKGHVESEETKARRIASLKRYWKYRKQREELIKHGINI